MEKLLAEKLNDCLVPVVNSLVSRVEELTSEVNSMRNVVNLIATPECGCLKNLVLSSLQPIEEKMDSLLHLLKQNNALDPPSPVMPSSSVTVSQQPREPFVTVTLGETQYPYFLSTSVWRQIGGCGIPRTIARVVLESLHTIKELREFTLSGKGLMKRLKENDTAGSDNFYCEINPRKAIPPESVEIALAVVEKVMNKSLGRKYEDKFNADGHVSSFQDVAHVFDRPLEIVAIKPKLQ
ncbi:unnamed protein product [Allacma fusca]|uniref:Uncharacterized protein n=1 Tax=Allacma fusca TaxID=39272 RepID=A0A8J2L1B1_9HEXA|nr:unnamed protein product [Allacma fusca]